MRVVRTKEFYLRIKMCFANTEYTRMTPLQRIEMVHSCKVQFGRVLFVDFVEVASVYVINSGFKPVLENLLQVHSWKTGI